MSDLALPSRAADGGNRRLLYYYYSASRKRRNNALQPVCLSIRLSSKGFWLKNGMSQKVQIWRNCFLWHNWRSKDQYQVTRPCKAQIRTAYNNERSHSKFKFGNNVS